MRAAMRTCHPQRCPLRCIAIALLVSTAATLQTKGAAMATTFQRGSRLTQWQIAPPHRSSSLVARITPAAVAAPRPARFDSADPVPPPDLSAILVLVLCCGIGAVCALDRVLISIAILPMSEQFAYSDATKGAIAAGFSLGYCLGLAPAGIASARSSPKLVLLAGLLLWSAAQAASPGAAAASLPALLTARALMGVGEAAAVPSLQVIAARFVPAKRRSLFWGILSACLSGGTIAAYVLSPSLIEARGWPFAFEVSTDHTNGAPCSATPCSATPCSASSCSTVPCPARSVRILSPSM